MIYLGNDATTGVSLNATVTLSGVMEIFKPVGAVMSAADWTVVLKKPRYKLNIVVRNYDQNNGL